MLHILLLSHLIGDYLLQGDALARWKARSQWGVLAHGGVVTLVTLACVAMVDVSWWRCALFIGLAHTVIDSLKTRFLSARNPTWALAWFVLDQAAHLIVIRSAVAGWGDPILPSALLPERRALAYALGYLLLAQPAWVLLRMVVRGVCGSRAAPPLGQGGKYAPIIERLAVATCVLIGPFYLVPAVMFLRHLIVTRIFGNQMTTPIQFIGYGAETLLSTLLAVGVGIALRAA